MSDSIKQAIETLTQLREAIQEAHGVLKDLRTEIKTAKASGKDLSEVVNKRIESYVKAGLDEYSASLEKAITEAEDAIHKRFDVLGAIFMGEDPQSVMEGRESLPDMIERLNNAKGRHVR